MPRARYLNTARHAVTLPNGRQIAPGEVAEMDDTHDESRRLAGAGQLLYLEHAPEPNGEHAPEPDASSSSLPDESQLGESTIQQSDPPESVPEQPVEPRPPGEPLIDRDKTNETTRRASGRKGR